MFEMDFFKNKGQLWDTVENVKIRSLLLTSIVAIQEIGVPKVRMSVLKAQKEQEEQAQRGRSGREEVKY